MKKLLLAVAISASATACAANDSHLSESAKQWTTFNGFDYGVIGVNVDTRDHFENKWMATTYTRGDGNFSVGIMYPDQYCYDFEDMSETAGVMRWNGKLVKMSRQCTGKAEGFMFPTTRNGARYVWEQFSKSNYVYTVLNKVNVRFSAKGFNKGARAYVEAQHAL